MVRVLQFALQDESSGETWIDVRMTGDGGNESLSFECGEGMSLNERPGGTQYHLQGQEKFAMQTKNWQK